MRIRRLTVSLPPRLRATAERDARLIAQQVADALGPGAGGRITLRVEGQGAPGHAIAQQVGRRLGGVVGRRG